MCHHCGQYRKMVGALLLFLIGIENCTVCSFVLPSALLPHTKPAVSITHASTLPRSSLLDHNVLHVKCKRTQCTKHFALSSDGDHASSSNQPRGSDETTTGLSSSAAKETTATTLRDLLNAAFLIAGTTVGGGFLALPTVVAPNGFVPSAVTLAGVWGYFWMESMVVIECLILCRQINNQRQQQEQEHQQNHQTEPSSTDNHNNNMATPGIAAAAKAAFGSVGERVVLILLVLLMEATLVSQISRAGAFFPVYQAGCAITAITAAGLVFGTPNYVVTGMNSLLTSLFCFMAVVLFVMGAPAADWSKLGLFASSASSGGVVGGWANIPQAIPTFLQLLVYGEILPAVCKLLKYRLGPIRIAITIGSLLPLGLEVGWAALGIGLLPTPGTSGGITTDPVNLLLTAGPVQVPLFVLAVTAISTTIIGSYLALQSAMDDVFTKSQPSSLKKAEDDDEVGNITNGTLTHNAGQRRRRKNLLNVLVSASWIALPALGIASISPDLFLTAIDFAGSYPVLLLWGLAPPAIAFRLRQKLIKLNNNNNKRRRSIQSSSSMNHDNLQESSLLPTWWLGILATLSLGLFGMSAIPDVMSLMQKIVVSV